MSLTCFDSRRLVRGPAPLLRRRHARKVINRPALVRAGDTVRPCTVMDISEGGARLKLDGLPELPDVFELILSWGARTKRKCQVRWRSDSEVGVQFSS